MFLCCSACFDELNKKNPDAAKSWVNICEAFVRNGIFRLKEHLLPGNLPTLRELEAKGFILTADAPDAVFVRVEGYAFKDDTHTFCINRMFHEKNQNLNNEVLI